MKNLLQCAGLLMLMLLSGFARAGGQETRACEFEVRVRCASGDARVTLADGAVIRVEVNVYWCALHGHPPFACTIDSRPEPTKTRFGRRAQARRSSLTNLRGILINPTA